MHERAPAMFENVPGAQEEQAVAAGTIEYVLWTSARRNMQIMCMFTSECVQQNKRADMRFDVYSC